MKEIVAYESNNIEIFSVAARAAGMCAHHRAMAAAKKPKQRKAGNEKR
jgi:hypothetical protein